MEEFNWHESEWDESEGSISCFYKGLECDVYPTETEWVVKIQVSPELNECPELYTIQFLPTRDEAIAVAEEKLIEAAQYYDVLETPVDKIESFIYKLENEKNKASKYKEDLFDFYHQYFDKLIDRLKEVNDSLKNLKKQFDGENQ